jgi:hypothetical protein
MQYTDQELLNRVASHAKGFKGFPNGILDIWVRSEKDVFDVFDDKVYTFDCRSGEPQFIMVCSGTSNAGAVGLKHFSKYNANGCAVLASDTIVYDSHILGMHKGKYNAFVENPANPFPYYRDSDKDDHAEENGVLRLNDNIGANCHHAGIYSTRIGGWSVACLVRNVLAQWNQWLFFMTKKAKVKTLTVAILNEF